MKLSKITSEVSLSVRSLNFGEVCEMTLLMLNNAITNNFTDATKTILTETLEGYEYEI